MKYKSRPGSILPAMVGLFSGGAIYLLYAGVQNKSFVQIIIGSILLGVDAVVFLPAWLGTYYVLEEEQLHIHTGLSNNIYIPYREIQEVKDARSPVRKDTAPPDRLEVVLDRGVIFVTPADMPGFKLSLLRHVEKVRTLKETPEKQEDKSEE